MKKVLLLAAWSEDYPERFLPIVQELRKNYPDSALHAVLHKIQIKNTLSEYGQYGPFPFDQLTVTTGTQELRRAVRLCDEYAEVFVFIRHVWVFGDDELFREVNNKICNAHYILRNLLSLQEFIHSGNDQKKRIAHLLHKNKMRDVEIYIKVYLVTLAARICLLFSRFLPRAQSNQGKHKILFMRLDVLGDMVLSLPALLALRETYADSELTVLVSKRSGVLIEEQQRLQPKRFCDRLIFWQASWHTDKERLQRIGAWFRLVREAMRQYREAYDLIVQPVDLGTGVVFAVLMRGQRTVAAIAERLPLARLMRDLVEGVRIAPHTVYHIADLPDWCAQAAGAKDVAAYRHTALVVSQEEQRAFARILKQRGYAPSQKMVAVNIGAGSPKRLWSVENYALLLSRLTHNDACFPIVIGGDGELALWERIASHLEHDVLSCVGKTNLTQLIALLSLADLVVSPDTGVMHLAAALDKKIVALFGAGLVPFCKPLCSQYRIVKQELGCSGCGDICFQEGTPPCISGITVAMVEEAISGLLYS